MNASPPTGLGRHSGSVSNCLPARGGRRSRGSRGQSPLAGTPHLAGVTVGSPSRDLGLPRGPLLQWRSSRRLQRLCGRARRCPRGRGPSLPSVHLAPQASAWSCSSSARVAPSSALRVPFPGGRGPASRRVSNTERCPERRGGRSSSLEVALDQRARGRFQGQKPLSAAAPGGHPSPWRRESCGPGSFLSGLPPGGRDAGPAASACPCG